MFVFIVWNIFRLSLFLNKIFNLVGEAVTIFDANTVGPRSYILMYDSYRDILTGQSERDKDTFLTSDASLDQFKSRMEAYAELRDEISQIRQTVQLNLFGLSCQELNLEMFTRTENLRLGLIKFQVISHVFRKFIEGYNIMRWSFNTRITAFK